MLAKFSVKKPYTVIVGIILVIALGVISFINMTTDLLPSMDLPYVIVYTTYVGGTPESVESNVTRPLEAAFNTLTDVKNITSTSSENLSLVVMEFEAGADMNTAMIEINSDIERLRGAWDDSVGTPVIMKLNPDMLPVTIATVSLDGADLLELSDYVEDDLISRYEAVDGVARVTASGILTQQVDITIEQSRIDTINNAILREIDDELADVELELRDAMSQLSSGRNQLAAAESQTYAQINEALAAIDSGTNSMPETIATLTATLDGLEAQRDSVRAMLDALDALMQLPDEQKAAIQKVGEQMAALQAQRDEKQAALDSAEDAASVIESELAAARSSRDEEAALHQRLTDYIDILNQQNADALQDTIDQLEDDIAANNASLAQARADYEQAYKDREDARADIEYYTALIEAKGGDASPKATEAPGAAATGTPAAESTNTPAPESTNTPGAASTDNPDAGSTDDPGTDSTDAPTEPNGPQGGDSSGESGGTTTPEDGSASNGSSGSDGNEAAAASADSMPVVHDIPLEGTETTSASVVDWLLGGSALAEDELTLEELQALLDDAQRRYDQADADVTRLLARCEALNTTLTSQNAMLEDARDALARLESGENGFTNEIADAQAQLDACQERIDALDARIDELTKALDSGNSRDQLAQDLAILNQQIDALAASPLYQSYLLLYSNPAGPEAQQAYLQSVLDELDAGIAQLDDYIKKLEQGILPGGLIPGIDEDTDLASARSLLVSARGTAAGAFAEARAALDDAEAQLSTAWKEFTDARDEALENAGIDGIITVQTISAILGSQNLDLPAGYVSNADDRYLVSVGTEFASLDELKQVKLFSLGLDTVNDVRLFDVASVEVSDNSANLFTFVNGERGIMLSFEKQSTASTAEVAENITAESEKLMAENERLRVTEMMNQGDYINLIVNSVLQNLLYGGILAIAVLLLFLLDWRPTLIVAISIPASVVVAFVCMYFAGITLNVMSLSGLALGVGMLVDNSIVSIENIYRLRDEEGLPILTASIRGVNQVAGALFASTLTTICVFLPVVFVKGMARDLFSDMGLTIAFSLLASLVVAMTVVPSAAASLFKKQKERKQRIFGAFQRVYVAMLRGALRVKPLVLLAAVALLVYSGYQVMDMGISFMPSVNSEQMSASLSFADATIPESEREAAALAIMDEILTVEGVNDVSLSTGGSLSLMGGSSGYSYYVLVDTELGRTNAEIAADMQAKATAYADGERAIFGVQQSTMDMSAFAGQGISIDITGENIQDLRTAAIEIAELCTQVDGAVNIDDGAEDAEPKLAIIVDKELASDNSLSVAQVYQYVAQRLYGAVELTSATLDGREYTLYVSEGKNSDLKPEDIADMEIEVTGTTETHFVRIGDIAEIVDGETLSSIRRDNQRRVTNVTFEVADGYSANLVSRDLEARLAEYQPPEGVSISLSGENESVMGYMQDLVTMLGIAVLFIFLIMVAQFQSFKSPIIVMFTIPLAFTGGLLALLITRIDLSIVAMVGFLVLSGVVVNNGIVFIDSVNQMRIAGMEKKEALLETGRIRLRPILMTALTTILGMSTMALGTGMGAEMMQPMAIVTIGGLLYATLMTLFVVPVLYDILNGKTMKAREIEMIKESAGLNRKGFDDDPTPIPATPQAQPAAIIAEPEPQPASIVAEPETHPPVEPAAEAVEATTEPKTPPITPKSARVRIKL